MITLNGASGALCGASVVGAAHRRLGKINQDAYLGDVFGDWSFIAVADGHGSAPHFRSDRGARLAVEAARHVMRAWTLDRLATPAQAAESRAMLPELPELLCARWRAYVDADLRLEPAPPTSPDQRFVPYGSTLAAVALSGTKALCVQIGDGNLLIDDGGGVLFGPLPADAGLIDEQTYSLCLQYPIPYFRCALLDLQAVPVSRPFAMAATDGLQKSFGGEENFLEAIRGWRNIVAAHGMQPAVAGLENWLAGVTEQGNGDDISLVLYAGN